jgi:phage tail sheath protein FI
MDHMPTFTYPGVYIEELSSGVHSITGVATSIAAFIGWAPQGPTDRATLIESWADYQALFGGLDARSKLGYSVNQFFANGGTQAYIVRLIWDVSLTAAPSTNPTPAATAVAAGVGYATAAISASLGAIVSPSIPLSVGAPVVQSLSIGPTGLPPIPLGATLPFIATGKSSDGTSSALAGAKWASSNSGVIAINVNTGSALATGAGTAILTATAGLISGTISVTVTAAALTTITVTPTALTLAVGQPQPSAGQPPLGPTQQLAAIGNYSDGTSQDLTSVAAWSVPGGSDSLVTASGLAIAGVTAGSTTTVSAKWVGITGTTVVTVGATAAVLGISIQQHGPVATVGMPVNFTAVAISSDSPTPAPIAGNWLSGNPAVATIVLGTGVATALAPGSTTITITSGSITASTTLTVTAAILNAVSITPIHPSVAQGLTLPLKALGIYSDGTSVDLSSSADWQSVTPADASVDQHTGVVTGHNINPTVAMTATWQTFVGGAVTNVVGPANVAVTAPVLQSIAITPTPVSLLSAGQTAQLKATGTLSDGTTPDLTSTATWTSSAPAIATVSSTGLAKAIASGGSLTLFAANPGVWGNNLRVAVLPQTTDPTRFGLLVQQITPTGQLQTLESFVNLSTVLTDPLFAITVIDNDSKFISFINPATGNPVVPTAAPSPTAPLAPIALSGGDDGAVLVPASDQNFEIALTSKADKGVFLLDRVDIFNLLCIPGETDAPTISTLQEYCVTKRAFYIVDAPQLSTISGLIQSGPVGSTPGPITGTNATNAAYYFPWVLAPDPLSGNRPSLYPPCGFVAGIYAATDAHRGVWKAPAGIQASLSGVSGLQYNLTDMENGDLNIQAINCLRQFKVFGDVVWGARTLQGNDQAGSEWKYIPIRRLALFIESSLYEGTQWVVFEPNDAPLWGQIRLNVGAFMQGLFLQGAFQGTSPQQAYFVKCDAENNPQASIDLGVVNILVGFAPLFPAEFVVIQIQQIAGQIA